MADCVITMQAGTDGVFEQLVADQKPDACREESQIFTTSSQGFEACFVRDAANTFNRLVFPYADTADGLEKWAQPRIDACCFGVFDMQWPKFLFYEGRTYHILRIVEPFGHYASAFHIPVDDGIGYQDEIALVPGSPSTILHQITCITSNRTQTIKSTNWTCDSRVLTRISMTIDFFDPSEDQVVCADLSCLDVITMNANPEIVLTAVLNAPPPTYAVFTTWTTATDSGTYYFPEGECSPGDSECTCES